jgi:hypothetical protein
MYRHTRTRSPLQSSSNEPHEPQKYIIHPTHKEQTSLTPSSSKPHGRGVREGTPARNSQLATMRRNETYLTSRRTQKDDRHSGCAVLLYLSHAAPQCVTNPAWADTDRWNRTALTSWRHATCGTECRYRSLYFCRHGYLCDKVSWVCQRRCLV